MGRLCSEIILWLRQAGIDVPGDVGVANLERPSAEGTMAGIDPLRGLIGGAAVELVDAQLHQNERGIPAHPKLIAIEGRWCGGTSVRRQ